MDLTAIIVSLIGGGLGGNGVAAVSKKVSLGPVGNTISGAIGGWLGVWLAGLVPGLSGLVTTATDVAAAGGFDFGTLLGQGAVGLVGGGLLTAIAGGIKNATAKS